MADILGLWRKTLRYLLPYRWLFIWAILQGFFISGLELLKPWPLKIIVDHVLGHNPVPWGLLAQLSPQTLLLLCCLGLTGVYLLLSGVTLLNNYTTIAIGQKMVNDFRGDLFHHLQRLSLAFHSRRTVGDLMYHVTADTYAIQTLTMNGVFPLLTAVVFLTGMVVVMLRINAALTFLALAVCPFLFFAISLTTIRITAEATTARQKESLLYALAQQAFASIKVIQAFTGEEEEHRRFIATSEESLRASLRLYTWQTLYTGVVNAVVAGGTALVLWVGARQVLAGGLTLGEMLIFISYLASLYGPVNSISQTYGVMQGAKVGAWRVFEILERERALPEGHNNFPAEGAKGEVFFDGVSFSYVTGRPVLQDISLRVHSGKSIAIVGPTGAGKTTLLSLLPRFYDPQRGRVMIDGHDVKEFRLRSLRQQIAMVLQPPLLFPTTIRENIAYGRPGASLEEIVTAARLAQIHDFVLTLPQGYESVVGEQGATLSEGERQRLTIARAILRNAPVLILDEPTSAVDAETEALIIQSMERLMAGKTTFIIAHRLSTVRRAGSIVVLREGRLVEEGTFTDLLRRGGYFAELYHTQFGEQPEKKIAAPS